MRGSPGIVRFGLFELDQRAGELRKAGVRLNLQPQPLRVLCLLVQRPGELVTREEFRGQLWPDDTFVDFQHGLNAAVNRLRETLGDSAETPRYVETLQRRGYRFIGPIEARPIEPTEVGDDQSRAQSGDRTVAPVVRAPAAP